MISYPRAIAHIDADCFFASVEMAKNPSLRGKPVGVCTRADRRGIITAASYECRKFGIRAGTPIFKVRDMCPEIILIPAHFQDYQLFSQRMFEIIRNFSPDVEVASIDEAYVDLTGLRMMYRNSYEGIAQKMQTAVFEKIGLPVSIGIASTKLLAKLASDRAKPKRIVAVSERSREDFLQKIPAGDVCGIGPNTAALLQKHGIQTALQFARSPKTCVQKLLGRRGEGLWFELNGVSLSDVETLDTAPKSLSSTETFPDFSSDEKYIWSFSLQLLTELLVRLRGHKLKTSHMNFFLTEKNFATREFSWSPKEPSSEDTTFISELKKGFLTIFQKKIVYRKSGVIFSNLVPEDQPQLSLFQAEDMEKKPKKGLDRWRAAIGGSLIFPGTLLYLKKGKMHK